MRTSLSPAREALFLQALRSHSRPAYNELYDRYANTLLGVITRLVRNEDLAQDVLQETFIKVWKNIHRYDPAQGRFFSWLLKLARNTALDHVKSPQNQLRADWQDCMADSTYQNEIGIGLWETVTTTLAPKHGQILELLYRRGYTHQEASDFLALPLGTIKTRARLALAELRRILQFESVYVYA